MLEIKDLDAKTMLDGFCTKPSLESLKGFEKTGSNLEEALAERRRFLSDRLAQGAVWGKIAYKDGKPAGWIDCFPADIDGWVTIGCINVEKSVRGQGDRRCVDESRYRGMQEQGGRRSNGRCNGVGAHAEGLFCKVWLRRYERAA
jgi:hypothetical protein